MSACSWIHVEHHLGYDADQNVSSHCCEWCAPGPCGWLARERLVESCRLSLFTHLWWILPCILNGGLNMIDLKQMQATFLLQWAGRLFQAPALDKWSHIQKNTTLLWVPTLLRNNNHIKYQGNVLMFTDWITGKILYGKRSNHLLASLSAIAQDKTKAIKAQFRNCT